mgnify:CR=1 FL=1
MNFEKEYNKFLDDGVILLKDSISKNTISAVKDEYNHLDENLDRREIVKGEPLIVFWKHVVGEKKRVALFSEFPSLWKLINEEIFENLKIFFNDKSLKLQLLETIIFNKPYKKSNILQWHQDVAYFPLEPNDQVAIWIPFEPVDKMSGALNYALGSHKHGLKGSTDLHTRKEYDDNERELIPEDPEKSGFKVKCMEMNPTDMVVHDGYTWHYSPPNKQKGYTRIGFSIRFITNDAIFDPRAGQAAAFTKQIDFKKGEIFQGKPFPVL